MSLLSSSSRRHRRLLFMAAAIAAGGYASYRICKSSAFERQRKRLLRILSTMSFCCEAVSQSAESMSILSSDLKSFLLSDDDTVPRSLQQALKISHSEQFQETVTVLSAALVRGLRRGMDTKPKQEVCGRNQFGKPSFQAWQGNDADVGNEDVACREIREVSFTAKRPEEPRFYGQKGCISIPSVEEGGFDDQEGERKSKFSGSTMHAQRCRRAGIVYDKVRRTKPSEDLLDKLISKLFSEPGVGFASAVTGTFARNLVLAFFDASCNQCSPSRNFGSSFSSNLQNTPSQTEEESVPNYAKIIDVLYTHKCRMLVAECLQTFISTAVTVYVEKTKDVNFYDDMVAGIVNPSHQDSVKDLLTSVCNSAIETLVQTSYDVFRDGKVGASKCRQQAGNFQRDIRECSSFMARNRRLSSPTNVSEEESYDTMRDGLVIYEQSDPQASSCTETIRSLQGTNTDGALGFIDGVSKTLAIPSNRKLILDVAGTMTSEAVRSFVNVVVSTASSHVSRKMHESWDSFRKYFSDHQGFKLQERSRDMVAKTHVLASICLAMCLHVLVGSQVLQT